MRCHAVWYRSAANPEAKKAASAVNGIDLELMI
jgi:hypothetical protein